MQDDIDLDDPGNSNMTTKKIYALKNHLIKPSTYITDNDSVHGVVVAFDPSPDPASVLARR